MIFSESRSIKDSSVSTLTTSSSSALTSNLIIDRYTKYSRNAEITSYISSLKNVPSTHLKLNILVLLFCKTMSQWTQSKSKLSPLGHNPKPREMFSLSWVSVTFTVVLSRDMWLLPTPYIHSLATLLSNGLIIMTPLSQPYEMPLQPHPFL